MYMRTNLRYSRNLMLVLIEVFEINKQLQFSSLMVEPELEVRLEVSM